MKLEYLGVFHLSFRKPIKYKEDYQKANDKIFLFEIEDEKYFYVGDKVFTFETNYKIVN